MPLDPALAQAFETTWPAAEYRDAGGFRIGRGLGGGGRISSARALGEAWDSAGIEAAAKVHRDWSQPELFRVWDEDHALGKALGAQGFARINPTLVLDIPTTALTAQPMPPLRTFAIWPPLAILREIWAGGNIAGPRQEAMERVTLPRISLLGRMEDHAAGAAFVAADGEVAMIHAIEVEPRMRRKGMAEWMLRGAAHWAQDNGAMRLSLAVNAGNSPAVALYRKLGFQQAASYAYWAR